MSIIKELWGERWRNGAIIGLLREIRMIGVDLKRKQTSFRDFVKEIWSWMSANIYKQDIWLSRYPKTDRHGLLIPVKEYQNSWWNKMRDSRVDFTQSFFYHLGSLVIAFDFYFLFLYQTILLSVSFFLSRYLKMIF